MTQDEIIRMAREAGFDVEEGLFPFEASEDEYIGTEIVLERFAALVAAHEREKCFDAAMKSAEKAVDAAMLLEREACAKVCDARTGEPGWCCADAIRARNMPND